MIKLVGLSFVAFACFVRFAWVFEALVGENGQGASSLDTSVWFGILALAAGLSVAHLSLMMAAALIPSRDATSATHHRHEPSP